MAEVITNPYDPSNPFDFNNQGGDGGFYDGGANMPWNPFANSNYGNPFTGVDPSNPYDTFPSGTYVGDGSNPFTGGLGGNPFGTVNFGGTGVGPYAGPTGTTQPGGFNPPAGWEVDKVDLGPWSQGGGEIWSKPLPPPSQFPNIQFGIPDFNIGTGGLIIGGGILGSGIFGGGGGGGGGMRGGGPDVESGTGTQGPIVPPITDGGGTQNPPLTKDDISGPSKDVLFPPAVWDGSMDQESKNRWDPRIPFPGTSQPPSGEGTKPADIIVPPIIPGAPPGSPNENTTPTTIYKPLGPVMPTPPAGGGSSGGGGTNPPTNTPPATPNIPINVMNRNYLQEGQLGVDAMRQLMPQLLGQYAQFSGQPGQADAANFYNQLIGQNGANTWNPELTRLANEQTMASNTALRFANVGDVEALSGRAQAAQRAANPELYGMLGAYSGGAQQQLANDYAAVGRGGQLTADEIRMAQQSAREAAGAQGRLRGSGTQAAEVLNRFQYQQQRDQQNRANLGQSQQAALGGMNASAQAAFNPFSTLLGQGMNTQNVGTNQTLFNQGTGFSSGALSNQYTQQLTNPFNPYAADVYGSNFNAENARAIANSNNSAARAAAEQALLGQALGSLFQTGVQTGWKFGF
jgi:hypothetical protein